MEGNTKTIRTQKLTEQQIAAFREDFASAEQNKASGEEQIVSFFHDSAGRILSVYPLHNEFITQKELKENLSLGQLLNPAARSGLLDYLETLRKNGRAEGHLFLPATSGGKIRDCSYIARRKVSQGNPVICLQAKFTAEAAREKQHPAEQSSVLHSDAGIFVFITDTRGRISYSNAFLSERTGYHKTDLIGSRADKILRPRPGTSSEFEHFPSENFELIDVENRIIPTGFEQTEVFGRRGEKNLLWVGAVGNSAKPFSALLPEQNRLQKAVFEQSEELILFFTPDGTILFVNKKWKEVTGYSDEEINRLSFLGVTDTEAYIACKTALETVQKTGALSRFETTFRTKSGEKLPLAGSLFCEFEYGRPSVCRAILHDNSQDLKEAETRKRRSDLLQKLADTYDVEETGKLIYKHLSRFVQEESFVFAIKNRDTDDLQIAWYVNSAEASSSEPVHGQEFAFYAAKHFDSSRQLNKKQIQEILAERQAVLIEQLPEYWTGLPLKDGETTIGFLVLQSFRSPDKSLKQETDFLAEIENELSATLKRVLDRQQLRQQAGRLKAIYESGDHLMWSVDRHKGLRRFNSSFAKLYLEHFGKEPEQGTSIQNLSFAEQADLWVRHYSAALGGRQQHFELNAETPTGRKFWLEVFLNPISDEKNRLTEISGIALDITEKKKAEEEMRKAKEFAEESLEIKARFLSNMSHEIRTPMNGILGLIQILSDSELTAEQKELVDNVRLSSDILMNIVNDILDSSKLEAGKMKLYPNDFSLRTAVRKVLAPFNFQAKQKDLELSFEIPDDFHLFFRADETRFLQILINLVSNAVKFTEKGSIRIRFLEEKSLTNNRILLRTEVRDTGIGISEQDRDKLFKKFSQIDNSYTKQYAGTGLGLSIAEGFSRLMGGEMGICPETGEGSCFWFTAEVEKIEAFETPDTQPDNPELSAIGSGLKVLVVDDNVVNLKVAALFLSKLGCDCQTAGSGFEVLALYDRPQDFDIIFMDIQMPGMNGLSVFKILKEKIQGKLPVVIAMTAYTEAEERAGFTAAGMNDYISKPVNAEVLSEKLKKWKKPEEPLDYKLIIDFNATEQIRKFTGQEFIEESFDNFQTETEGIFSETEKALKNKDWELAGDLMHKIKGSAATLGLIGIKSTAEKGEEDFKNRRTENADNLFNELKKNYADYLRARPSGFGQRKI